MNHIGKFREGKKKYSKEFSQEMNTNNLLRQQKCLSEN